MTASPTASSNATADRSSSLTATVRHVLCRMDTSLTLDEAKGELSRQLIAWRKAQESGRGTFTGR